MRRLCVSSLQHCTTEERCRPRTAGQLERPYRGSPIYFHFMSRKTDCYVIASCFPTPGSGNVKSHRASSHPLAKACEELKGYEGPAKIPSRNFEFNCRVGVPNERKCIDPSAQSHGCTTQWEPLVRNSLLRVNAATDGLSYSVPNTSSAPRRNGKKTHRGPLLGLVMNRCAFDTARNTRLGVSMQSSTTSISSTGT